METAKVIQQHKRICKLVTEKKIKQSLDILDDMIVNSSTATYRDEFDNIIMTYRNILQYTIEGVQDPERGKVYLRLIQSILKLSDRVRQDILSHYSGWHTYWVKGQSEKELRLAGMSIVETVDDLIFKKELDEWLKLSSEVNPDPDSAIFRKHKQLINNIFNHQNVSVCDIFLESYNIVHRSG